MSARRFALVAALLVAVVAGALIAWRVATSGERRAAASFEAFSGHVVPVLDRRCGSCHGLPQDAFDEAMREPDNRSLLRWVVDASGRIATPDAARLAYERATTAVRTDAHAFVPIDRGAAAAASLLVRAPLAAAYSGFMRHVEVFATPDDPDYRTLVDWVSAEIAAAPAAAEPLSEAERVFAAEVAPVLVRLGCLSANCHGDLAFNDLKLDPGLPLLKDRFTSAQHRANRAAMLGAVSRLVNLAGSVDQSRQLLKAIPIEQGGIVHRGGNAFLEKDSSEYAALRRWLEIEARDIRARASAALGSDRGLVFVRRPAATPERFFEDATFLPGGDLIWAHDGREVNLTAALHPGAPADVRAPDVSYDATRVAFAMRRSNAEPFNVWEVQLQSGQARQLTFSRDPAVHFVDPLYVPDPDDADLTRLDRMALVVVSNREGQVCEASPDGRLGEADGGDRLSIADAGLTEQAGTYDGRAVRFVRGTNEGERRTVTRQASGRLTLDRPLPRPVDSTTHYVIDAPPRAAPCFDAYRLRLAEPGREAETFDATLSRMTFTSGQVRRPTLRSTGEIMFTALRTGVQSGRPFFNGAIFRTHVDGSNFHTHGGNRSGVPIHADSREMANGLEVRIGRDAESWWGGTLIVSDHQIGPTIEPDNPLDDLDHPYRDGPPRSSHPQPLAGFVAVDPTVRPRGVSPGGAYRDPYPVADGSVLVAHAPGPIDLSNQTAAPNFDIVRVTPSPSWQSADGLGPGRIERTVVVGGPMAELWPRPVTPRLKEPVSKRLTPHKELFGEPGRVRGFAGYADDTPGVLQLADLYLLDAFFEQVTPVGARHLALPACPICGLDNAPVDQVRGVRVVGATPRGAVVIAEVPVEADGSFQVAIPSGMSFDVQSTNADGMALRSPHRWLYVRPGERHTLSIPRTLFPQTCGGCHGGLTGKPADTFRKPDAISSASRTLANWNARASRRIAPANWTGGGPAPVTTADFERDVRPILNARCASCHSASKRAGGLLLEGAGAFPGLRRLVEYEEGLAVKSYLMEKLLGRELHAVRSLSGERPHPARRTLSPDELRTLVRWIDLGARPGEGAPR